MLQYEITARRIDAHGSTVRCKEAELVIDTDLKGRADALNPAELLLAAVAACILKNMERVAQELPEWKREINRGLASLRMIVEFPFRIVKRQFKFTKVRYRGLFKNGQALTTKFALANLYTVRRTMRLKTRAS